MGKLIEFSDVVVNDRQSLLRWAHGIPNEMYLSGETLRNLARELGSEVTKDCDGNLILDEELYRVTKQGIFRV